MLCNALPSLSTPPPKLEKKLINTSYAKLFPFKRDVNRAY